ncbi:MAG: vitamin K epoxide reductase family protein [Cytophagia bacterium]|nr:vitamin K epoxide reductase family protein [Cytophagia bacterium]
MDSGTNRVFYKLFKDNFGTKAFADFEYELNSHPDYPTLKSISDTLDKFGIENAPVKLKPKELEKLDSPYLAYIQNGGHRELAYVNLEGQEKLSYTSESKSGTFEDINALSSIFNGVAVLLDLKKAKVPHPNKKRQQTRFLFKLILLLAAFCFFGFLTVRILNNSDVLFTDTRAYLLLIAKLAGLTLSSLLIFKDIGHSNQFIDRVCKIGKQANCNTVLESKYATFYSWIKWSDIGFIYFLSSCLLLTSGTEGTNTVLAIVAFPYVFVSLYQQLFLIKKLCPLCLGIVLLLSLDFSLQAGSINNITLDLTDTLDSILILASCGTAWLAIKSLILSKKDKQQLELRYNRLKRIPKVVSVVTNRENRLIIPNTPIKSLKFGTLGKESLKIQAFLSLHCGYCARLYQELDKLLISEKLEIDVFLNFSPKDSKQVVFADKLLNQYDQGDKGKSWISLGEWFSQLGKYNLKGKNPEPSHNLKELFLTTNNLMRINQITELPKLFIEEFEKSSHYKLTDYIENLETLKPHNPETQNEMIINT